MTLPFLTKSIRLLTHLPAPRNLSTFWNFGSLLGLCLGIQLATGIFLAIHYVPQVDMAFDSCIHITRDVNFGWALRNFHANGASLFFICLYLHIGRRVYYGSYYMTGTWLIGVLIFLLVIVTAFLGYVLVWGQIRFWAATVITSLLSAIPYVGQDLVQWIWGDFSVRDATLRRFFTFHFIIPFVVSALVVTHLALLHTTGSSNPLGVNRDSSRIPFHPYYTIKDVLGIFIVLILFLALNFLAPDLFAEPDNFIPADPLVTPAHIKPEWYFLWVYALLRAVPHKLGGVIVLVLAVLALAALPAISKVLGTAPTSTLWPLRQIHFWLLVSVFLLLTWLGRVPAEPVYTAWAALIGRLFFLILLIVAALPTPEDYALMWVKFFAKLVLLFTLV